MAFIQKNQAMQNIKTVLITGANGYIGSSFISKYSEILNFIPVSISSGTKINFSNIDVVVHLSALVHQKQNLPEDDYFKINAQQTQALAEKAKNSGVKHFIFFSTVSVYGTHGYFGTQTKLLNEDSPCFPKSSYARSKYYAEKNLLKMESKEFKISIIRPPLVYGKNCTGNIQKLKKLIALCPILPFDHPDNMRSMVHIDNLSYFLLLVIEQTANGIFIPQDESKLSIKEIVKIMSKAGGKNRVLFRLPKILFRLMVKFNPSDMASLYGTLLFDSSYSNKRLGYTEVRTTADGLLSLYK